MPVMSKAAVPAAPAPGPAPAPKAQPQQPHKPAPKANPSWHPGNLGKQVAPGVGPVVPQNSNAVMRANSASQSPRGVTLTSPPVNARSPRLSPGPGPSPGLPNRISS